MRTNKKPLRHEQNKKSPILNKQRRADSFEVIEIAYVQHIFYWIIRLKRGPNEPINSYIAMIKRRTFQATTTL